MSIIQAETEVGLPESETAESRQPAQPKTAQEVAAAVFVLMDSATETPHGRERLLLNAVRERPDVQLALIATLAARAGVPLIQTLAEWEPDGQQAVA